MRRPALAITVALLGAWLPLATATAASPLLEGPNTLTRELEQARAELVHHARAAGEIDITLPVLERFNLKGSVDATLDRSGVTAEMVMRDDLSGVYLYAIQLVSPSGQTVDRWISLGKPQKRVKVNFDVGRAPYSVRAFNKYSEAGTWKVNYVYLFDAANNLSIYSAADLAALGNIEVPVSNLAGFDMTPPELVRGAIGSRSVSLSKPPKGTPGGVNFPPFAYADLQVRDAGNGRVAGIYGARMDFCRVEAESPCLPSSFSLSGLTEGPGIAATELRVGGMLPLELVPGVYKLVGLYMADSAENAVMLSGPARGGDTHFGKYFDGFTITVDP